MATSGAAYKQDLPPSGGYDSINYKRVPAKTFFKGRTLFAGYLAMTTGAFYLYFLNYKAVKNRELEMRCATLALYPMLLAERDRAYLKQLRLNREEESKLMANVEGWKTGMWYSEPLYQTVDKNTLIQPLLEEYYAHASYNDFATKISVRFRS